MAGHASPDAVAFDPCVGVARTNYVVFTFVDARLAINAGDYGGVAVDVHGESFIVKVIGFLIGRSDPLQIFGFVHDRTVVIRVDERVVDEIGDSQGLVPVLAWASSQF